MSAPRERRRVPRPLVVGLAVVVLLVVVNLLLVLADRGRGGAARAGPDGSSFVTTARGLAAYRELLDRYGYPTAANREALGKGLDPESTAIVWDPQIEPDDAAIERLRSFVEDGGRLVVGASPSTGWIEALLGTVVPWEPSGPERARGTGDAPESDGVGEVRADGFGSFTADGDLTPVVAAELEALVVATDLGRGRVVLVADPSILENRRLADADNARLGITVVGEAGRTVRFVEGVHGYESSETGIDAVPAAWRLGFLGLAAAVLLAVLARGRRIGPPEERARALPPARRAYVDSMGATFARTRDPQALAPMRAAVRQRIAAVAGLDASAPDEALRAAAERLGWPPDEIAAVLGDGEMVDVVALGRASARAHTVREPFAAVQGGGS